MAMPVLDGFSRGSGMAIPVGTGGAGAACEAPDLEMKLPPTLAMSELGPSPIRDAMADPDPVGG